MDDLGIGQVSKVVPLLAQLVNDKCSEGRDDDEEDTTTMRKSK